MSRRIQNLEVELGTSLLDRHSKPLRPTQAGRDIYAHGRRILSALEDMKAEISSSESVSGEFRIGVSPYLSEIGIARLTESLRNTYPELVLCIKVGWPEKLLQQLRQNEVDVAAFCLPDGMSPATEVEAVALDIHPLLVVSPRSLALSTQVTLEEVAQYPWIMNQDGCGFRSLLRKRFQEARLPLQIGVEALSSDLRLTLVARGLGLTIASRFAVENSSVSDALRVVHVEDFTPKVRAWIVRHPPTGRLVKPIASVKTEIAASLAAQSHRSRARKQ